MKAVDGESVTRVEESTNSTILRLYRDDSHVAEIVKMYTLIVQSSMSSADVLHIYHGLAPLGTDSMPGWTEDKSARSMEGGHPFDYLTPRTSQNGKAHFSTTPCPARR